MGTPVNQPSTNQPSDSGKRSVFDFLDANKTNIAAAIVAIVGYFYPPAQALVSAYPDLALVAVGAAVTALRELDKHPGVLRK